jgi:nucleoside-diphosphate-sugar epimerase
VFGDGTQSRDFTYVDDIAKGTVAAIKSLGYQTINLGSDRPVELHHVIRQISQFVGRAAVVQHRPAHPADVPATWAAVSKAKALLGWFPETSLDKGLMACVAWYKENRGLAQTLDLGV